MQFVDTQVGLEDASRALAGASHLFVDTEFESNRFGSRICLLQVSRGDEIFLVDALKLSSLGPLRAVFADPRTEWVLHAGLQDVNLLVERLELEPPRALFDTQVAWGLLTAESAVSLAYLQFRALGLRTSKTHQADDWTRRPLPPAQLDYAAADVQHLPELRRILGERARELGREEIVQQASLELLQPLREAPQPLGLDSFRNAWQLEPRQQAGLQYLIASYNALSAAERESWPETKTLLAIASRLPESVDALGRMKGVPRSFVQRAGADVVSGLRRAAAAARAEDFVPIDPIPYATFEEIRLDAWFSLARAEVCATVSAAPELVLPGRLLRSMRVLALEARAPEAGLSALSGWRRTLVEPAYERFCQQYPAPL
jgi:ribonuclease D